MIAKSLPLDDPEMLAKGLSPLHVVSAGHAQNHVAVEEVGLLMPRSVWVASYAKEMAPPASALDCWVACSERRELLARGF